MSRTMKDSGIPWIGEIPEGWSIERNKNIFRERTELSEDGSETLLSVSEYYGVAERSEKVLDREFVSRAECLIGYKKCYKGDLVSNIMLAWKGSLGVSEYDGIVSPAYCVYEPYQSVFPRYYHYLFRTSLYTSMFRLYSKGIIDSRLRLYSPYFFDIKVLLPPLAEQHLIATFLDKKCSEIDSLIDLQEQMIEELKAYKQSVITEAVTKGLNPNVQMKDSGIEWIGEIPEGWKTAYLKHFCKVNSGREIEMESEASDVDAVPVFGSGGVFKYTNKAQFAGEAVMFGRKGTLGKPIYVNERFWAVDTMYYLTFGNMLKAKYCYYQLSVFNWEPYITQTALPSIVATDIVNTSFAFPPLAEQQAIADYLDKKCGEIDELITIKQQKIESLKEYKKSVIYEYVTGKREA